MGPSLWAAAMDGNRLEGLEIDHIGEEVRWGSIYLGRVSRIDKAMDAAFVELDCDNTGILHNTDIRLPDKSGKIRKGGDKAIGQILQPGQMIVVQARSSYTLQVHDDDLAPEEKCAQLSMDITVPGRYLIFSPFTQENKVSARIRDPKRRKQLMKMMKAGEIEQGCILRSAAADMQTDILIRESRILKAIWEQLQGYFEDSEPGLIMDGPDAIQRSIADQAGSLIERIEIVTMDRYQQVEEWCEIFAPDLVTKIIPVELPTPQDNLALFDYRDIMGQVDGLLKPYVLFGKGANLIVQSTAALHAVDVNRGGDTRSSFDINLEAAKEIARQIRLRNLGGIIVVDMLKMKDKKAKKDLLKVLEAECAPDSCTVQIHGMTKLGLIEMTRKRRMPALHERIGTDLEY